MFPMVWQSMEDTHRVHINGLQPSGHWPPFPIYSVAPDGLLWCICGQMWLQNYIPSIAGTTGLSLTFPIKSDRRPFVPACLSFDSFKQRNCLCQSNLQAIRFAHWGLIFAVFLYEWNEKCMRCKSLGSLLVAHTGKVNLFLIQWTHRVIILCLLLLWLRQVAG